MRAVPASGTTAGVRDASAELLTLDDDRVRLVSVVATEDPLQSIVRLQSVADERVTLTLGVGCAIAEAARSTYLGDAAPGATTVEQDRVRLTLEPFEAAAVRVTRQQPEGAAA